MPQPSWQQLVAEHKETYARFLDEVEGNRKEARELFLEDLNDDGGEGYYAPTSFEGKWLVITPNFDGTRSNYDYQVATPEHPILHVKSKPLVWIKFIGVSVMKDLDPSSKEEYAFPLINGDIVWSQYYTRIEKGKNNVRLVKHQEPKPKLYVPRSFSESGLVIPLHGISRQSYIDYYQEVYGESPPEKYLTAKMREYRTIGMPLHDDPLKDFVLPNPRVPEIALPKRERILTPRDISTQTDVKF